MHCMKMFSRVVFRASILINCKDLILYALLTRTAVDHTFHFRKVVALTDCHSVGMWGLFLHGSSCEPKSYIEHSES